MCRMMLESNESPASPTPSFPRIRSAGESRACTPGPTRSSEKSLPTLMIKSVVPPPPVRNRAVRTAPRPSRTARLLFVVPKSKPTCRRMQQNYRAGSAFFGTSTAIDPATVTTSYFP